MGRPRLSDISDYAQWDFLSEPEMVEAVEYAARRAERSFDHALYEDCYQEACLWVAVRPEMVEKYRERGPKIFGAHIYSKLSQMLEVESRLVPDGREATGF